MIHKVISAIWVFLIIVGLSGCQPESPLRPKTTGLPMKIAIHYWPGHFWVEIAHNKGWIKEAGLNVELVDVNDNFLPSVQDWVDGKMDVNHPVFFDLIKFNAQGADLVAVVVTDLSFDGDGIVARKEIENVKDLRGKSIGLERGTFTEFLLSAVLNRNRMTLADVELVQNPSEKIQPLVDGKLDALVTWEPHLNEAADKGKGYRIFGTAEIPGLISDVIGFHRSFISRRPGDVQAYVNVWHKTTTFIKENPKEAFGIIASIYNKSLGEVQAFAQVDKILNLKNNLKAFTFGTGFESLYGTAREINNFMINKGMVDKQMDSSIFIDGTFIRNLRNALYADAQGKNL